MRIRHKYMPTVRASKGSSIRNSHVFGERGDNLKTVISHSKVQAVIEDVRPLPAEDRLSERKGWGVQ